MQSEKNHYFKAIDEYRTKRYKRVIEEIDLYLNEHENNGIDAKGMFILAKSYNFLKKKKDSVKVYKVILKLDPKNSHARVELGKLYASQGKEESSKTMYEYIIDRIGDERYEEENRIVHITKHLKDNKGKKKHGVFTVDPLQLLENIKEKMNEENKRIGYMADIYLIEQENCGYEGGTEGDGHILNYVTIITLPYSKRLITMFPSDNIFKLEKDFKSDGDEKKSKNPFNDRYKANIDIVEAKKEALKGAKRKESLTDKSK